MKVKILNSLSEISQAVWNELVIDDNPFLKHQFLYSLEESGCATEGSGWKAQHVVIYDEDLSTLLLAMPCYLKDHSYGEYIFDWAWANAFHQNGIEYYPKLSNAIPFTPATGQRILIQQGLASATQAQLISCLHATTETLIESNNASGFHSLFIDQKQLGLFESPSYFLRENTQFHWHNHDYADFDGFLAELNSKKRKNIKRERRRVIETGVQYRWHTAQDLDKGVMRRMYQFYLKTIYWYGAQAYLNEAFFERMADHFSEQTLVLFAYYKDEIIAGGLFFKSDSTLYGRYWGALDNFHSVHFETCYYQAIEYCIENGLSRFEAGAQGHHKVARGLLPNTVYSAHKIKHPQFHELLTKYTEGESQANAQQQDDINQHSPFKNEI